MLLRDRDVGVDQATIGARLELPVVAPALAERLSSLSGLVWRGGALYVPGVVDWELIAHISDTRGTWAALLEPHGPRHVGHWVVVDGISEDGIVRVRDPVGEAYGIPLAEFLSLWEFTVVVMEETSR